MGRVLVLSNRELFGSEKEIDTLLFKKIEFAIPTLDVVMAFKLTATNLNVESFSACKKAMLAWPFCRALILSPPSLVNKVRGSIREAQKFVQSLATIRHLLTPWAMAATELQRLSGTGSQLEALEESEESEEPPVKRSCLEALENRMTSMFNILYEKIDNQATQCPTSPQSLEGSSSDEWEGAPEESESEQDRKSSSGLETTQRLAWDPLVKECERPIPEPKSAIRAQGIRCQKLGSSAWNKIRYLEVQKRLGASPVFNALKVNNELTNVSPSTYRQAIMAKTDLLTGTLSHGLLIQRERLSDAFNSLVAKHPVVLPDIKALFLGDSPVSTISDDLLHYTCARRAEFIEMRRNAFKAPEPHHAAKLAEVPPSESHLFEEKQLSEFLNQQGGVSKVFPPRLKRHQFKGSHSFRPRTQPNSENTTHPRLSKARPSTSSATRKPEARSSKNPPKRRDSRKRSAHYRRA
ncbi:uncharacterized protein LOC135164959 [Diachasmimorpha longicaudata]|uniref:uncharacterized protein LOC135164959 n=1 Tax=Diachasmimorpha longicaudata TaxID=58733 RepID=UPI0030B8C683